MSIYIGESTLALMHGYKNRLRQISIDSDVHLPFCHLRILKCIHSTQNCRANDIVKALVLDKSQVTRAVKSLVNEGYVTKLPCTEDQRSQRLKTTECGGILISELHHLELQVNQTMTTSLTPQQKAEFLKTLNIMLNNLR
ncbi:MarR family winged helix-turn-helix transcriptional regulator [Marinomonas algarum]|uniref:MarR family winged helix-turn-helix transcriptional regulator n=1 Tax=Marinomonas algarum TaxID=2883105 RepID=A0A9X1IME2_9GAMM|nr:MarR family winged helix-turn-helix transcriptional regulator [Marinomonas algarum]MCB5161898.1 MarR family winged helix-turn-helix transcriptional regulator [Marinomonas algarum]